MTTIEIDAELGEKLRAAAEARGMDFNHYAIAVLREAADEDLDTSITDEEKAAIRAGVKRGLKAHEAGRHRPAEEFYAEMSRKHGLPG